MFHSVGAWGEGRCVVGGHLFPAVGTREEIDHLCAPRHRSRENPVLWSPNQRYPLATRCAQATGWVPSKVLRQFGRTATFRTVERGWTRVQGEACSSTALASK